VFKGEYRFMGLMTTKSHKIASIKYEKKKITVWTDPKQMKQEVRYAFVDQKTGSFRIVKKRSLKNENPELALYARENQNWKSIQDQLRSTKKKGYGKKKKPSKKGKKPKKDSKKDDKEEKKSKY